MSEQDLKLNKIIEMGIAGSNSWVYTWFSDPQVVIVGSSRNLGKHSIAYFYSLPEDVKDESGSPHIIGIGIAKTGTDRDWCYAWYKNNMRSAGKSHKLGHYFISNNFDLPANKSVEDIVGMGISSKDYIYTWYKDNTRSYGTSWNLGKYKASSSYTLPEGKKPEQIIGMAIAPNDWCYAWYSDGRVSAGTSTNLGLHGCNDFIIR